jgi:hypothetical protein
MVMRTLRISGHSAPAVRQSLALSVVLILISAPTASAAETVRVTQKANGTEADSYSYGSSISDDGKKVAFGSRATNLVKGDKNGLNDVFVRNMETGKITLVSTTWSQDEPKTIHSGATRVANGPSDSPAISGDGKWVAFASKATNLVRPADGGGGRDTNGDTNNESDVFLRNLTTGNTILVSARNDADKEGNQRTGNNASYAPVISDDGSRVAFVSSASDLTSIDDTNGNADVFYYDRKEREVFLLSQKQGLPGSANGTSGGVVGNAFLGGVAISGDGKWAAYGSTATNLTAEADANGDSPDVYYAPVAPRTGSLLASSSQAGVQGNNWSLLPSLNEDGTIVAFLSNADNLIASDTNNVGDIFVKDLRDDSVVRANVSSAGEPDGGGALPLSPYALDNLGTRIVFTTFGGLGIPGPCMGEQVYMHRFDSGVTSRVSVSWNNDPPCGNGYSNYASISGNGEYATWTSYATDMVSDDTNGHVDIFRRGVL